MILPSGSSVRMGGQSRGWKRSAAATPVSATTTAIVDKVRQPIPTARDLPNLMPSLQAMLERLERHSGELLELEVTPAEAESTRN
jgi:hypothetical protein